MKFVLAFLMCLTATLLCVSPASGDWGDGFAQDDLSHYLENAGRGGKGSVTFQNAPELRGKRMLVIQGKTAAVFHRLPVQGDTKYTLSLRARMQGGETIEENPILEAMLRNNVRAVVVPRRQIRFFDGEKKLIRSLYVGMPFGQWHDYEDVFHTPANTAEIEISFIIDRPELTLQVDDVKLAPTPDEGALNCHPVFATRGLYNYSGIQNGAAGSRLVTLEDGTVVFDARYGSSTFPFPLAGPGEYELSAKAQSNGYAPTINVNILDENNKSLMVVRCSISRQGKPTKFVMPAGARHGRILMRSVLVEEVRLVRVDSK